LSFMKIGSVIVILYSSECINIYLYFLHVLTDLGEIIYMSYFHIVPFHYFGFYENR